MNNKHTFLRTIIALSFLLIFNSAVSADGETLKVLNDTVVSLYEQGKYDEAAELSERALKIAEETMGADNHQIAPFLNNLAVIYYAQGKYAEAAALYERSKKITEPSFGADHPRVKSLLESIAKCRQKMSEEEIAEENDLLDEAEEPADLPLPAETEQVKAPEDTDEAANESVQRPTDIGKKIYTVQVGAFKNLLNAKGLQEKLDNNGYDVSLTTVTSENGETVHKVQVGEFTEMEKAKLRAQEIRTLMGLNTYITTK
jgi:cell division septation protein DedD